MMPAVLRGTALGSALGILPGGGALLAAFAAYTLEKKIKLQPGEVPFGKGNIRGVAAPESANNAGAQTSFIPLLTLGIPPNAVMALMVGAMTIHNIQPGPQVMTSNPELFWGLIASMWIGNAMLIILNLPLIGMWIKLLTVPYKFLFPAIVLFCAIGVYSTNNNTFDIWMVAAFGFIGYLFLKLGCEPAPLLLGFILGPMMEENLRRALLLSRGDWSVFVTRPLSAGLLAAAAAAAGDRAAAGGQGEARRSLRRGVISPAPSRAPATTAPSGAVFLASGTLARLTRGGFMCCRAMAQEGQGGRTQRMLGQPHRDHRVFQHRARRRPPRAGWPASAPRRSAAAARRPRRPGSARRRSTASTRGAPRRGYTLATLDELAADGAPDVGVGVRRG